jgi:hypothetical protein
MVPRILILRAALIAAALLALGSEARAQCSGQPPGNQVCASPNGAAGLPGFRPLVTNDLPALPAPAIAVNSTAITGGTSGRIPYNNSGVYGEFVVGGDCTFSAPNFTCTKTGGATFAPSATTDTTNAGNIASGTLNSARVDQATAANFIAATANKMLPADKVFTAEVTISYGTTTTFDFSTFINAAVTLSGGNITTITFTNVKAGQAGLIRFIQDGTGSRTIPATINSTLKCAGACNYVLSTAANAVDVLGYTCVSATYCIGGSLLKDVK